MATKYTEHFNPTKTHQSKPIPGREADMVQNNAGGYTFQTGDWTQANRFLILGAEGGTYYANEGAITVDNAQALLRCLRTDGSKLVDLIVDVSYNGKSYKNDACIFALALVFAQGDAKTRLYAASKLDKVLRIGTHMLTFTSYVDSMRGWGRGLREAVASWYTNQQPVRLAYQLVKYRNRGGWSHRDVLRLAHPKPANATQRLLFNYAVDREDWRGMTENGGDAKLVEYLEVAHLLRTDNSITAKEAVKMITAYDMPRETLRTELLNSCEVWEALLQNMPMTAMIRNLGKMTAIDLLKPLSAASKHVVNALHDAEALKKARIHPIQVLAALGVYRGGRGIRGSLNWAPVGSIVGALDDAFYKTFDLVEPTGLNTFYAIDASGSMSSEIAGVPGLKCRDAAAALAMVNAKVEDNFIMAGFIGGGGYGSRSVAGVQELPIDGTEKLPQVVSTISKVPWGTTDCAQPMLHALRRGYHVDLFAIYTDNETWEGNIHVTQALKMYRDKINPNARVVVAGMTSTGFSIADPKDPGMMDVVGFSTDTPKIISEFALGNL